MVKKKRILLTMNHYELLKNCHDSEDKLCLAQVLDKLEFVQKRGQIEATSFLSMPQISLVEAFLRKNQLENYSFFGGYPDAERQMLFFYPPEYTQDMVEKNYSKFLKIASITFDPALNESYEHRIYLSGIMKLGIRREKVGDILVRPNGADILFSSSLVHVLPQELASLTRFRGAEITVQDLSSLQLPEKTFTPRSIIVPSLRLDNLVSDLAKISRSNASILITSNLVFLNGKCNLKPSKAVQLGDVITIRKKGKFIFREVEKTTKSGNLVLKIDQYT